jgi:hypothetical protein
MRLSITLAAASAVAAIAFAGAASAASRDMTDGAYVELYRSPAVQDRADTAREDVKRNVVHSGSDDKAKFVQERDGQCLSLLQ